MENIEGFMRDLQLVAEAYERDNPATRDELGNDTEDGLAELIEDYEADPDYVVRAFQDMLRDIRLYNQS